MKKITLLMIGISVIMVFLSFRVSSIVKYKNPIVNIDSSIHYLCDKEARDYNLQVKDNRQWEKHIVYRETNVTQGFHVNTIYDTLRTTFWYVDDIRK